MNKIIAAETTAKSNNPTPRENDWALRGSLSKPSMNEFAGRR
jgi:hypothetical protein